MLWLKNLFHPSAKCLEVEQVTKFAIVPLRLEVAASPQSKHYSLEICDCQGWWYYKYWRSDSGSQHYGGSLSQKHSLLWPSSVSIGATTDMLWVEENCKLFLTEANGLTMQKGSMENTTFH